MTTNQKLPIVLAHGFARFDILLEILRGSLQLPETNFGDLFQYFKGSTSRSLQPELVASIVTE